MNFKEDVQKFNAMYRLPVAARPTLSELGESALQRLKNFKIILLEELEEFDNIFMMLSLNQQASDAGTDLPYTELEILTALADLLGDIQVYCASEMCKFGLPWNGVLQTIMASNFSKLGADGEPIYDERGKVQKEPGYWKPEPALSKLLEAHRNGPGGADAHALLLAHHEKLAQGRVARAATQVSDAPTGLTGAFDPLVKP